MIPILLLDLAGVVLVIGYVMLDRRQSGADHLPGPDRAEPGPSGAGSSSLPVEPIVAQRPLPSDLEPRRIRRPNRAASQARPNESTKRN